MHEASVPALLSVVAVSVLSFVGATVLALGSARTRRVLPFLVALSAGALLGDAFLHLLPEAVDTHGTFEGSVAWSALAGLLGFFAIESLIHWHHHGEDVHEHRERQVSAFAWMNLLGDGIHNFVDGLLIAGTWMVSPEAGLATTVAVALHEVPQEFGDFGVLLAAGLSPRRALLLNAGSAAVAVLGAVVILAVGGALAVEPYLLPVAAGGFVYVACADLVPEIHRRARGWNLVGTGLALGVGLALVVLLPALASGQGHTHGHPSPAHGPGDAGGHDGHDGHEHGPLDEGSGAVGPAGDR